MIFTPTPLSGAFLINSEPRFDERGLFIRAFCAREFKANGLKNSFVQANISTNSFAGTVRGLHFQRNPHAEDKLVRCIKGSIFDVIVDLREESPTFLQWFGSELSEGNCQMMYVPKGFAHGYQSLDEDATVSYMVTAYYQPSFEGGCRFDDPVLAIRWPRTITGISEKDAKWPLMSR
ncbi:MAG: dTDP-4-dehydrorhamnose 3,5-epimerase [Thermoanaerobaculales bacterium]|nr:dTDP-4-dehydrorhamnose 3,5-epimerase [Thermoanaerobaculales bacterium]